MLIQTLVYGAPNKVADKIKELSKQTWRVVPNMLVVESVKFVPDIPVTRSTPEGCCYETMVFVVMEAEVEVL